MTPRSDSNQCVGGVLHRAGYDLVTCSLDTGLAALLTMPRRPGAVVLEVPVGFEEDALTLARRVHARRPDVPMVLLVDRSSEELAIAALKAGADDYFGPPLRVPDVLESLKRLSGPPVAARQAGPGPGASPLVGSSAAMRRVLETVRKVAVTNSTVLLRGETGTGKELIARLIHDRSARGRGPFVCVNCAAIPDTLLESEFFGHEKGAFTGAAATRPGAFQMADGGTLVLDEIGDMSARSQAKVLRVLESRSVRRLGGDRDIGIDVRIVASTHRNLLDLIDRGAFRRDLYYRLNVVRIHLPSLRDRREDIPELFGHCLERLRAQLGLRSGGFTPRAMSYLLRYDWPGNVRELQNLVESIVVTHPEQRIDVRDLPESFRAGLDRPEAFPAGEKDRLLAALVATDWNKSRAARKLRWSRMTVYRKMAKYDISPAGPALSR
ncbi:MAG: sigma-54 dependent transcriptional regulator [Gemmatimonadota bacterium]